MKRLVLIPALLLALAGVLSFTGCEREPVIYYQEATGSISVQNLSDYEVSAVYVCRSGCSSWGDDVLDHTTLSHGDLVTVGDLPTGRYDLYAETPDGVRWEEYNMKLTTDGFTWKIR